MWVIIGLIGFLLMVFSGVWIAAALGLSGILSLFPDMGSRSINLIAIMAWDANTSIVFAAVPLFILMGEVIGVSGIGEYLYSGANRVLKGVSGGLNQATLLACTAFAAVSGSSVVSAATMGRVAGPEMTKRKFDKALFTGTVAAGGTLGILIPPSIPLIIYGGMTGESVGALYMAGIVPGLLLAVLFMLYVGIRTKIQPKLAPANDEDMSPGHRSGLGQRAVGLWQMAPFLALGGVVLGSIYGGVATPTEAASVGATGAMAIAIAYRRLTWTTFFKAAFAAARTSAILMFIVIGAKVMSYALAQYGVPPMLGRWASGLDSLAMILLFIFVLYLVLGCFFDAISMMLLTLPFITPIIRTVGIDPVWFGIVLVVWIEIGLLTPPVGLNLFVVQAATGVPLGTIIKGSMPFLGVLVLFVLLITFVPAIVLWLPHVLMR